MKPVAYIVLSFKFKKEDKRWTAYCEELGTATYANSLIEAQKRIKEAALLHLNTLEEVGECERFLKEHNIQVFKHKPKKDEITLKGPFSIDTFASPYIYPIEREYLNL